MNDIPPSRLPPPGDPRTLYVVDISGYVFRAYHALPAMTSASGEPTHAVLGTTTMLQRLVTEQQPAMLAVAMDSRTPSFRDAIFAAYKANRPPAPPDLKQQMLRVREVLDAYRLPVLQQDGMEADDLIASVVKRARHEGLSVVIVSSDKDLLQLVGDGVWMLDAVRSTVFGKAEVEAKLGVPPAQVRDYLALVGDTSDNVPGVPSVGPKTAVQLLKEFGDVEHLFANLDRVERKPLREKLEAFRDQAFLSRELVTLKDDLVVNGDPAALVRPEADLPRLRALFRELGFTRLLAQLGGDTSVAEIPVAQPMEYSVITDDAGLSALATTLASSGKVAVFTLMDGVHPVSGELVGLAFAYADQAAYLPLGHRYLDAPAQLAPSHALAHLRPWFENAACEKICADSKRVLMVLAAVGVEMVGVVFDTMLASYLIDPEAHGHRLDEVARFELGEPAEDQDKQLLDNHLAAGVISGMPLHVAGARAVKLATCILRAHDVLAPRLLTAGCADLLHDIELPLARVLADIELTGIRVDTQHLAKLSVTVSARLVALEAKCKELAGRDFNVGSPRQLEVILFDELHLPVVKRTKTARSTDQSVLEELAPLHPLPATILEQRMLAKLRSTYLEALPREVNPRSGRIHTDFRQAVAATGRLSSSDPNLQNIPIRTEIGRSIRDAFIARDGWEILSVDYSQIELRVLAHLSHDRELLDAYQHGADVHARTARAIFGVAEDAVTREMRAQAKTVNFAVIYGQTQFALARNLGIDRAEAARYIKAFFEQYAGVAAYMDKVVVDATESGEVRTLCGRVRRLPELRSRDRVARQAAERVARNTPIQGSAADIIKLAMIAIHADLQNRKMQSKMLLTVHDELVFEAPPDEHDALEALVCDRMEHALALDVPLVADKGWGTSWGQAH